MVMEVGVRHGDPISCVGDVNQAVVVIFALAKVTAEIEVIQPDVGGLLDSNAITAFDFAELQVADNDVLGILDREVDASDG